MSTDVGAVYRSSITVYNDIGALTTPGTKTCTVTLPDQSTASATVTVDSEGKLHADYTITHEGLHKFVWSTVSPTTSKVDYENGVAYRSVIGLGEMRDYLHLKDTTGDEILRGLLGFATELAERIAGTCVVKAVTNERIAGWSRECIRLPQAPVMPSTSIVISSTWPGGPTWTLDTTHTELIANIETGVVEPANWFGFWYGPWNATYTAGRLVIPQRVVLAVKLIVSDLWSWQRGQLDDPLMPMGQQELEYEARIPPGYEMPPQARALLKRGGQPGFA